MVTNNFIQAEKMLFVAESNRTYGLIAKNVSGDTRYISAFSYNYFPASAKTNVQLGNSPGIWLGSGNSAPNRSDYKLESKITSGISATSSVRNDSGIDANGNPQLKIVITITNTSNASINISEIGYVQTLYAVSSQGGSINTDMFLLDRTVLETPVSIPAGESAAITYILKTVIE